MIPEPRNSSVKGSLGSSVKGSLGWAQIGTPQKGPENGAARKASKSVEKVFDTFLTIFDVFCPAQQLNCRKVSKNFLTFFDVF